MISVILYGRNDSHGYNLHKRAAISLNCIGEVLSEPGDEIIFVDYNTPNDLPTFIEAIYDTLTPRARSRLRVLRVRPELHGRYQSRTHLTALEPHSRNIAIRRSNSQNRWVLSTNTDMIFVPSEGATDLNSVVRDLPDGHYVLPRFELPEPLWESFPRQDPLAVISACERLGKTLHLNEVAASHPYMGFDSPGDFQLIPREMLFDIFGFDERMIHGWHADSNLCKRLFIVYGATRGLERRLKGYHCDHTRVATLAHRLDIKLENDLGEFVYDVNDPYARQQASSWGMPEETIEEINFSDGPQARFVSAIEKSLEVQQSANYHSDANDVRNYLFYQPEHVLPYIAGNFTVYPPTARFLYIGNNPRLLRLLVTCVGGMGFQPMHYLSDVMSCPTEVLAAPANASAPNELLTNYELLIFDLGLDAAGLKQAEVRRITDWPRELRYSLGAVARRLESCAEESNKIFKSGSQKPMADFLVVNANHYVFDQFVSHFLIATQTPYNTHVRKGRPRVGDDRLYKSHRWMYTDEMMRSFFGYDADTSSVPRIAVGQSIDFTTSGCSSPYKDGHWGAVDFTGTWTDGKTAEILLASNASVQTDIVAQINVTEAFLGLEGNPIRVTVRLAGEPLARWSCQSRYGQSTFKVVLPYRLLSSTDISILAFEIENPQLPSLEALKEGRQLIGEDPRELGIKIQSITFGGIDQLIYTVGNQISFLAGGDGMNYVDECWTTPDCYGAWTLGSDASLVMYLAEIPHEPVAASFTISDSAVNDEFPHMNVHVSFNGEAMATWTLGPKRSVHTRKVIVKPEVLSRSSPLRVSFHVETPRSSAQLKWSDDSKPLGFRLTRFQMEPARTPAYRLGDVIDFTDRGNGQPFLDANWSACDHYGTWTTGPKSSLTLRIEGATQSSLSASFVISDCMVGAGAPTLPVRVNVNEELAEEWILGPDRKPHQRTVQLSPEAVAAGRDIAISFETPELRSPASLGWSQDPRLLGLRLTGMMLGPGELPSSMFFREATARTIEMPAPHGQNFFRELMRRAAVLAQDIRRRAAS